MIAVDTSSFIAYLKGDSGRDVDLLDEALEAKQVILPPAVLTELLSDPQLDKSVTNLFKTLPTLDLVEGYWERAGRSRSTLLAKGHKARLADTLVAQSCLDARIGLLTRDNDFKAFARLCGLVLIH